MPEFTSDWFSHNIPAWQSFFGSMGWSNAAPKTVVEIGSYEGRSSLWILENLLQHPDSVLHCVDVFANREAPDSYWHRFKANILDGVHGPKVQAHATPSFPFMNRFVAEGRQADFIYIDGSHRAADVLEDLVLAFRALRTGGLIICDDYLGGAGVGNELTLGSPKIAIDAFTTIFRDRIEIIGGQPLYQLAFYKRADRNDDDATSRGEHA